MPLTCLMKNIERDTAMSETVFEMLFKERKWQAE